MLMALWNVLLELGPWLLLGATASALLHRLAPVDLARRQLQGRWGVVKAVALGVPLPLCSCGVIPAALGLRRQGASSGASLGFLIATPQTGVDSILVSAGLLGWPFALLKMGAALVTGVVGGAFAERLPPAASQPAASEEPSEPRTWLGALRHGVELLRTIWRWLLLGIVVSAAITVWVPPGSLDFAASSALAAGLVMLLVSLPLYVCATASVPIAAALVQAGMPVSAALVFLMAGPATNVATVGAVYRSFGLRHLGVYLAVVILGSLGFALAFDGVLTAPTLEALHVHEHTSWWRVAGAAVLAALMLWFASAEALAAYRRRFASAEALEIHVEGMKCGRCESRLQTSLSELDGVRSAVVSQRDGQVMVEGSLSELEIREAIKKAGFHPT